MRAKVLTLLILMFHFWSFNAPSMPLLCQDVYDSGPIKKQAKSIFGGQDYLAYVWGQIKFRMLREEYETWRYKIWRGEREDTLELQQQYSSNKTKDLPDTYTLRLKFIDQYTRKKPLKGFIDIDGHFRLYDNHHRYYAIYKFLSQKKGKPDLEYFVRVRVDKDYTQLDPEGKPWTAETMIQDLVASKRIDFETDRPTIEDLRALPPIHQLPDSPARSFVNLIFLNIHSPVLGIERLKGSDFDPHVHKRYLDFLREELNFDFFERTNPNSPRNIAAATAFIQSSKKALQWLRKDLNAELPPMRRDKIEALLKHQLKLIETSRKIRKRH